MKIDIQKEWNGNEGVIERNNRYYVSRGRWEWQVIIDGDIHSAHRTRREALAAAASVEGAKSKNAAAVALGVRRSAKKTAAARVNGMKGGRPRLRFTVTAHAGAWLVVDRASGQVEGAPTYHAARAVCRQRNASSSTAGAR